MWITYHTAVRWTVYNPTNRKCLSVMSREIGVAVWTADVKEIWLFEDDDLANAYIEGHKLKDVRVERVLVNTSLSELEESYD